MSGWLVEALPTRWRYRRVAAASLQAIADPAAFDELGKRGWELVGFDATGAAWFKRPFEGAHERHD